MIATTSSVFRVFRDAGRLSVSLTAAAVLWAGSARAQEGDLPPKEVAAVDAPSAGEVERAGFRHRFSLSGLRFGSGSDGLSSFGLGVTWEQRLGLRSLTLQISPWGGWSRVLGTDVFDSSVGVGLAWYPLSDAAPAGFFVSTSLAPGLLRVAGGAGTAFTLGATAMVGYNAIWKSGFTLGVGLGAEWIRRGAAGPLDASTRTEPVLGLSVGWAL